MKDDGLFNIPPHFPPFRLPSSSSSSSSSFVVAVVVPRKRSRSMRKLPRQELLTINYSSRYTLSLRSGRSPPLLMQMTAEPAGSERSTRHLLTVTRGSLGDEGQGGPREGEGEGVRVPNIEGEARIAANLHFIARARDRLPGSLLAPSRIFIRFLFSTTLPTTIDNACTRRHGIVIRIARERLSIFATSINIMNPGGRAIVRS